MLGVTFRSDDGYNTYIECDRLFRVKDPYPLKVELFEGVHSLGCFLLSSLVSVEFLPDDDEGYFFSSPSEREVFHYDRTPY